MEDVYPHTAAAASDPIEDQEFDHITPNLLHVTTFLKAAVGIRQAIVGLERCGYEELDARTYLLALIGAARLVHVYIVYVHQALSFLAGRVYCKHSGALIGILENHLLIGELNVGDCTAEEYAAMSFPGQKDFEDNIRFCFWELREIAHECVIILSRIPLPEDEGPAAPSFPVPSEISEIAMPDEDDEDDSDDGIDQPIADGNSPL